MPRSQNRSPCMCLCPLQACHRPLRGVIPGKARRCPGHRRGTAASVPARATPGYRPLVCRLGELERLRSPLKGHGRVPRGFRGLPPGVIERGLSLRARSTPGLCSSLPRHQQVHVQAGGAQQPGTRAGRRVQEMPSSGTRKPRP
ncbi:hypothetical protein A6R68_07842 [Neotoma lepida]|uniref:Uncharacterized protein n=1 Tax=Neotoma lepida TaxID=56216 RepID=A0A1A6GE30_NEOLE|nr:hypothetical protein A6R68_07842 [Neotoma lepida]